MKRKKLLWIMVVSLLVFIIGACTRGVRRPGEEIFFPDPVLEQAIRNAPGYSGKSTGPIYESDVLGITELVYEGYEETNDNSNHWDSLRKRETEKRLLSQGTGHSVPSQSLIPRARIASLEGIQHLIHLVALDVSHNQISNISPLQNLTNLETLSIWDNQVSDISPLQSLIHLVKLDIDDNQLSCISPLENLTNLQWLVFSENEIISLTPLQHLINLQILWFADNLVSDLGPLENLTDLVELAFLNNQVGDLAPLQNLTHLESLVFDNNQISDISLLQDLPNLKVLSFNQNQVSELAPLLNLNHLWWLRFANNQVDDISSLVANASNWEVPPPWDELWESYIDMRHNLLNITEGTPNMNDIQSLIEKGITVEYDPQGPS